MSRSNFSYCQTVLRSLLNSFLLLISNWIILSSNLRRQVSSSPTRGMGFHSTFPPENFNRNSPLPARYVLTRGYVNLRKFCSLRPARPPKRSLAQIRWAGLKLVNTNHRPPSANRWPNNLGNCGSCDCRVPTFRKLYDSPFPFPSLIDG